MAKKVDYNGFWKIDGNPLSKVGVFPYLGKQISDKLEPNRIYMVYRPAEELFSKDAIDSFNKNPVPLIENHEMIGKGFTPAEKKGVEGVINNIRRDGDKLVGDISIYSDRLKDKITNGKKDLSMGYFCNYELADGDFEGHHYDAIQRDIRSNHVALVDRGRMGSEVRVYDSFTFDCAIETMYTEDSCAEDAFEGFFIKRALHLAGRIISAGLLFAPGKVFHWGATKVANMALKAKNLSSAAKAFKSAAVMRNIMNKYGSKIAEYMVTKGAGKGTSWWNAIKNSYNLHRKGRAISASELFNSSKFKETLGKAKGLGDQLHNRFSKVFGEHTGKIYQKAKEYFPDDKSIQTFRKEMEVLRKNPKARKQALALIKKKSTEAYNYIKNSYSSFNEGFRMNRGKDPKKSLETIKAGKIKVNKDLKIKIGEEITSLNAADQSYKALLKIIMDKTGLKGNSGPIQGLRTAFNVRDQAERERLIRNNIAKLNLRDHDYFQDVDINKIFTTHGLHHHLFDSQFAKLADVKSVQNALEVSSLIRDQAISGIASLNSQKIPNSTIKELERLIESRDEFIQSNNLGSKTAEVMNILTDKVFLKRLFFHSMAGGAIIGGAKLWGGNKLNPEELKAKYHELKNKKKDPLENVSLPKILGASAMLSGAALEAFWDASRHVLPRRVYRRLKKNWRDMKETTGYAASAGAITPIISEIMSAPYERVGFLNTATNSVIGAGAMGASAMALSGAIKVIGGGYKTAKSLSKVVSKHLPKIQDPAKQQGEPDGWITYRGKHIPIYNDAGRKSPFHSIKGKPSKQSTDAQDPDIQWVTVKGQHIPIKKGQSVKEGVKEFFANRNKNTPRRTHNSIRHDLKKDKTKYRIALRGDPERVKKVENLFSSAQLKQGNRIIKKAGEPISKESAMAVMKYFPITKEYKNLRSNSSKKEFRDHAVLMGMAVIAHIILKKAGDEYATERKQAEVAIQNQYIAMHQIVQKDKRKKRD